MVASRRGLVVGILVGLAAAAVFSCGEKTAPCTAETCSSGCCDADGVCRTEHSAQVCGTAGNACRACAAGSDCVEGACVEPPVGADAGGGSDGGGCDPASCAGGCCDSATGACVALANQSGAACGTQGVACVACGTAQTCDAGQCTGTACGPSSCAGCCSSAGTCESGDVDMACGTAGGSCTACGVGQSCTDHTCAATTRIGDPCIQDSDCSGLGAGALCKQVTSSGNAAYPGGYCTTPCNDASECGLSGRCGAFEVYGEGDSICLAPCGAGVTCRTGYSCQGDGSPVCWLSPLPMPPAAPGSLIGSPCAQDSACRASGAFPGGTCQTALTDAGEPTGFIGGYCQADCSPSPLTICGTAGTCVAQGTAPNLSGQCFRSCTGAGQSSCRSGYVCDQRAFFDGPAQPGVAVRVCVPQ